ncbi:thioredoxin family protein [Psychroserpens sp. XS_ASV72]|uniref:thioredoxin family protein n=1 Tax=Psychroserpens sp. XS_ASV72 TaxID=3241293 RepID=UPI003511672F
MKKIALVILLLFSLQITAQNKGDWFTDYEVATAKATSQNQNMLVFATGDMSSETEALLNEELFNSETFKRVALKVVLLQLSFNDTDAYTKRIATHYTGVKVAPAVSLVDANGNRLGVSLTAITKEHIQTFLSQLEAKLQ